MPRIACRWPGGHNLVLLRPGAAPLTQWLNGPAGEPSLLPQELRGRPSRDAATLLQKRVADTIRRMQDTAGEEFTPADYGVTEVPGAFWTEWYDKHRDLQVVTQRMVFAL